ncbi:MAG TPA: glycosyltransferase family 39 protein [Thermoanaerobaculia bacterium]|nr:glycosyltransferase family 39 protein [Thermoanaerobaculia bacterium]
MTPRAGREAIGAAALVLAGVGLRLGFVGAFPTEPVSDFRGLVVFGLRLRDEGLAVPGWHWVQFNAGLPLLLSALFRLFPHGVAAAAREATAVVTGLTALLPFLIWRPILGLRARLFAGALLALWPGQVFFSGVVAQENWVLPPTVALACLAVRRLRDSSDPGHPVLAGVLFAAAVAIRQEMLVVLLPPALAAAGLPGRRESRARRLLETAVAAAIPLLALALERRAATGRFALTTDHGGLSVLGTLAPGSAAAGWVDPTLFAVAVEPGLSTDPLALRRAAWRLAAEEARRRWRYHAFRAGASAARMAVDSEAQNLFWSLGAPGALPAFRASAAAALTSAAAPLLRLEMALVSGFFLAATAWALARRDRAILVVAAAVLLRTLVQVVFSPLGRLMVPAIALALLALSLFAAALAAPGERGARRRYLVLGAVLAAGLLGAAPALGRLAVRKDEAPPRVLRVPLTVAGGKGLVACEAEAGRFAAFSGDRAVAAPDSGSAAARVRCRLPQSQPGVELGLDLEDRAGLEVTVRAGGVERPERFPLPGGGWARCPLAAAGAPLEVVLEGSAGSRFGFGFVRSDAAAPALPRHRDLP